MAGVLAEITLAGGGHEARHPVVLRLRKKDAGRGLQVHSHLQQRFQPARLLVQQADLDHVEVQQVAGEVQDVRFQQLDAVRDRHVRDFRRRQVGQLHARLVDGRHLLLLVDLVGHVADIDDQVARRAVHLAHRGGVNVVVAVFAAAERRTGRLAGGQSRVEGAEVGPEDFRAAQDGVEVRADHRLAVGPFTQPAVAPDHRILGVQQNHAVGHALENLLVLEQLAQFQGILKISDET